MVKSSRKFFKAARYRYVVPIFILHLHIIVGGDLCWYGKCYKEGRSSDHSVSCARMDVYQGSAHQRSSI